MQVSAAHRTDKVGIYRKSEIVHHCIRVVIGDTGIRPNVTNLAAYDTVDLLPLSLEFQRRCACLLFSPKTGWHAFEMHACCDSMRVERMYVQTENEMHFTCVKFIAFCEIVIYRFRDVISLLAIT
jgi:hypothetical protein